MLTAGCVSSQCSGKAFRPHFLCREGGDLLDCSVGGLRVGSASAGVRCRGEGICAVSYQLCGDGFSGDPAAEASLGPLAPLLDHVCLNGAGKSPCGPGFPCCQGGGQVVLDSQVQTPLGLQGQDALAI